MLRVEIIRRFIKENLFALLSAALVGLVFVSVHLIPAFLAGDAYRGIVYTGSMDDYTYLARIQDVLDGHPGLGSAFFYEYKNMPALMMPMGEYFYAIPSYILGISASSFLIFAKFLFPAILFLLIYFLIKEVSAGDDARKKINAIAGSVILVLGHGLVNYSSILGWLAGKITLGQSGFLVWQRPVNPVTGALFLSTFLLVLWKIANKKSNYLFLPAGIILGLMVYYFFSWGVAISVTFSLMAICIVRRDYDVAKKLFWIMPISFLVTPVYWYNMLFAGISSAADSHLFMARNGMFFGHQLILNKFLIACFVPYVCVMAYEYFKHKKVGQTLAGWWWFCLALLLGSFIAYNQQVITGRTVWPGHFVQYTIPIVMFVTVVTFYNEIRLYSRRLWLAFIVVGASMSVLVGGVAVFGYRDTYPGFVEAQKMAELNLWLNKNTPTDCVVLTTDKIVQTMIPAYTHCNTYLSDWTFSGVPQDRIDFNFLVNLRMKGVASSTVDAYLDSHHEDIRAVYFSDWKEIFGDLNAPWISDRANVISKNYKEFVKKDFAGELRKYRLDYILSNGSLPTTTLEILAKPTPVGNFDGRMVYKFAE